MYNRPSIFQGRNGSDQLSVFLVAIAIILAIIYPFFENNNVRITLCAVALVLCAISVFRMFSSNVAKRRAENDKFLSLFSRKGSSNSNVEDVSFKDAGEVSNKEKRKNEKEQARKRKEEEKAKKKALKEDKKTHAYFTCPKCNTQLRVPKGKGKIKITCPKCGEQFIKRT